MANKPVNALNLDVNAQRSFIIYYKSLGDKAPTTIRFFNRGEYYSIHGADDAEFISKLVFKSPAHVKLMSPGEVDDLPYVTLSKGNFENAIRDLLLVKNYRVEVYVNDKGDKHNKWRVEYHGSPGNLYQFEHILYGGDEVVLGNAVIAIQLKTEGNNKTIGLACVDSNDTLLLVTEFLDDDYFTELEATAVLLGPKECILPSADGDFTRIKTVMERNGVLVTIRKKSEFSIGTADLVRDLNKLLKFQSGQHVDANSLPEISKTIAMSALAAAIKYLDLISDAANLGNFELRMLNLNRYVHLDAAAVSALNILPKPGTSITSPSFRWQSILGVLDRCRTPQGHRLMAKWVKQPLRNEATLKDRHDIVEAFLENQTILKSIHDEYLKRIPDILILTKKLLRKKANLQDIFRIYQVLLRVPKITNILKELDSPAVKSILCDPLTKTVEDLEKFEEMVEQILDMEALENGEYLVKSSFDDQLTDMKEKMDELQEKMKKQHNKVCKDLGVEKSTQLKLEFVSHLGYHLRMSLKDDNLIRKNSHYKVLDAIKGGVRFTNDKLSGYSQEFCDIKASYEEQQQTIVEEVIRVTCGYFTFLNCLNGHLAELDCLVSFSIAAISAPTTYVRPKILPEGSGVLELKQVRHPCLELQEGVKYYANDVSMKKDETLMYIITGPNMGGKSTFIRSIGTAVLMAHIGAFVPCDEATISMVDSILGRVGAGDNIIKGLSTFMVEMIETSGIIRTATDKSLVIIDELGRGTSTYEGCGIAWSIAEHLAREIKCFTLFATHFHEITELSEYVSIVKNFHMEAIADNELFTLLYKVKPGVMDKSFGIHVAKLAQFPDQVVKMAQKMYEEFEDQFVYLKSTEDDELIKKLQESVENLSKKGNVSDDDLKKLVEDVHKEIKGLDSIYFKKAFPALFQ